MASNPSEEDFDIDDEDSYIFLDCRGCGKSLVTPLNAKLCCPCGKVMLVIVKPEEGEEDED